MPRHLERQLATHSSQSEIIGSATDIMNRGRRVGFEEPIAPGFSLYTLLYGESPSYTQEELAELLSHCDDHPNLF